MDFWTTAAGVGGAHLSKFVKSLRCRGGAAGSITATGLTPRCILLAAFCAVGAHDVVNDSAIVAGPTNTVTETVINSHQFPADRLTAGKRIIWKGLVSTPLTHSTDTFTAVLRIGAAALTGTSVGTSGAVNVANDNVFEWHLEIVVRSATSIAISGWYTNLAASGSVAVTNVNHALVTIAGTAPVFLGVTGQWSVADVGNTCQTERFTVAIVGDKPNDAATIAVDGWIAGTDVVTTDATTAGKDFDLLYIDMPA